MASQSQQYGIAAGISMFHGHFPSKGNDNHDKTPPIVNEPVKSESPKDSSFHLKPVGSNRFVIFPS